MAPSREGLVRFIGVFKLVKAALVAALGIGALVEMPEDLAREVERSLAWLGVAPGREVVQRLMGELMSLGPSRLRRLGIASLFYAAVFLVEGVGLVLERGWAEWLTVAVTASFIPLELYELLHRPSAAKVVAIVLNAAIAAYLAWRRIEARRGAGAPRRSGGHRATRLAAPRGA